MYRTGFFGIPGKTGGKVHVVNAKTFPVCGYLPHFASQYQHVGNGVHVNLVECKSCRRWAENHRAQQKPTLDVTSLEDVARGKRSWMAGDCTWQEPLIG